MVPKYSGSRRALNRRGRLPRLRSGDFRPVRREAGFRSGLPKFRLVPNWDQAGRPQPYITPVKQFIFNNLHRFSKSPRPTHAGSQLLSPYPGAFLRRALAFPTALAIRFRDTAQIDATCCHRKRSPPRPRTRAFEPKFASFAQSRRTIAAAAFGSDFGHSFGFKCENSRLRFLSKSAGPRIPLPRPEEARKHSCSRQRVRWPLRLDPARQKPV